LSNAEIAVFVVATTGNGHYPSNCDRFRCALRESGLDLSGLKFALLGLESYYYTHLCHAGNGLSQSLTRLGVQPLIPHGRSDWASADAGDGAIAGFLKHVTAALARPHSNWARRWRWRRFSNDFLCFRDDPDMTKSMWSVLRTLAPGACLPCPTRLANDLLYSVFVLSPRSRPSLTKTCLHQWLIVPGSLPLSALAAVCPLCRLASAYAVPRSFKTAGVTTFDLNDGSGPACPARSRSSTSPSDYSRAAAARTR